MDSKVRSFLLHYRLPLLLLVSAIIKLLIASSIELGNDEVYYINYALFPEWSHFDHPPMVGWIIQLFTLNLAFDSEMWIRLASVACGTMSTLVIYHIGASISDKTTGWYSAILYNLSLYGFIITGIFMMPDSPQMLFWLTAVLLLIKATDDGKHARSYFLLAGVAGGLAMLSKYTSIFIFFGAIIYFIKNRQWLTKWYVYAAVVIAIILFLPVVYWNIQNEFVSFTFHSDRVEMNDRLFRLDYFGTEIAGQILYNNPFNFGLIVLALVAFFKKKLIFKDDKVTLLLYISLPLIIIFLGISLFRSTLPHWTGPAYITLIPIAALWLRQKTVNGVKGLLLPRLLKFSAGFLVLIIVIALMQIYQGSFLHKGIEARTGKRLGIKDVSLDMYGWEQLGDQFSKLYATDVIKGTMDFDAVIVSHRWFPAANMDYYVARQLSMDVLTLAPLERTHKYAWITDMRGGYSKGMDAYFISSSYDFADPNHMYSEYFTRIEKPDTIPVYRKNLLVKYYYVWRMKDLLVIPPAELTGENTR